MSSRPGHPWRTAIIALVVLGCRHVGTGAGDEPGERQRLLERVTRLEAAVSRLEAARDDDRWLNERRAAEVRALVSDVLADADMRAGHLDDPGVTAGYDNGFFLASPDGNFLLKFGSRIQVRFTYNGQNNSPTTRDSVWGFAVRRLRLRLSGHILDPSWEYFVQVGFSSTTGTLTLLDALFTKRFEGGWALTIGQFKLPFTRERDVGSTQQLPVDRSLVNRAYNLGRSQALQVTYLGDEWHFKVVYGNGAGQINQSALTPDTTIALTGRAEYKIGGTWKQFRDFTSPRGSSPAVLLGAAIHYERGETGSATAGQQRLTWTADATGELGGAIFFAAFVANHLRGGGLPDQDQVGVVVQGGYYLTDTWEGFVRYEWSDFDQAGVPNLSVITAGVNKFFHGLAVRWTTDVGVGLNPVASEFASAGVGWRADSLGRNGQVVVRSQLNVVF